MPSVLKSYLSSNRTLTLIALYFNRVVLKWKKNISFGNKSVVSFSSKLEGNSSIGNNSSLANSFMGYGSYIGNDSHFIKTRIGRFCSIGSQVSCIFGKHPTKVFVSTHPAFFSLRKQAGFTFVKEQLFEEFEKPSPEHVPYSINIGNDVWIGNGVSIMDGINIGDGAIVAANSLVTKDVQPFAIVGGSPAKAIRFRFEQSEIDFLLEYKWWNKSPDWIERNATLFRDISLFKKQLINEV